MHLYRKIPEGLKFTHPAMLMASLGGIGFARKASGTFGSFFAVLAAVLIVQFYGQVGLVVATITAFAFGTWGAAYVARSGEKDSSTIVIDELVGQWICLAPFAYDIRYYLIGFLFFRIADIFKPWPASFFDKKFEGPIGVMMDDVIAGLYAGIWLMIVSCFIGYFTLLPV